MLKKNEIVKLEITGMTNEGNGVGRYNEIAVFVPFTAVGDVISCKIVKVSKSYCYGIAERFISEAEVRISPDCQVFGKCGGCSFRHFSYEEELKVKQDFVESSFRRIGKLEPEFEAILGCEKLTDTVIRLSILFHKQTGKWYADFIQSVHTVLLILQIAGFSLRFFPKF